MDSVVKNSANDGATQRDHLLQLCKQTGKTPEELGIELPDAEITVPEGGECLWSTFWELSLSRGNNGFTENPIPWREIAAFSYLSGVTLTPFEAETLRRMDTTYLATRAEMSAKK